MAIAEPVYLSAAREFFERTAPQPLKVKNTFIDIEDHNVGDDMDDDDIISGGGINTRRQYSEPIKRVSALADAPVMVPGLRCTYTGLNPPLQAATEALQEADIEDDTAPAVFGNPVPAVMAMPQVQDGANDFEALLGMSGMAPVAPAFPMPAISHAFPLDYTSGAFPCPQAAAFNPAPAPVGQKTANTGTSKPSPEWENVTTVMMRHLSNQYTQRVLLEEISQTGFSGKFDFLYLPIDPQTGRNKGYAFMNFNDPGTAWLFRLCYDGRKMNRFNCSKVVSVTPAALQGFDANYAHYSTTRVTRGDPAARPLFLRQPSSVTPQVQRRRGGRARRGGRGSAIDQAVAQRQRELQSRKDDQDFDDTDEDGDSPGMASDNAWQQKQQPNRTLQQQAQLLLQQLPSQPGQMCVPNAMSAANPQQGSIDVPAQSVRPKFCTSCGSAVKPTYKFCEGCGVALRSVAA